MRTIKKIQRPFSREEWRKGNVKVETRDGQSVRLLCIDLKNDKPIIAAITDDDNEHIRYYYQNGRLFDDDIEDAGDLVIIEEVEEPDRWEDNKHFVGRGWFINDDSDIYWENSELNNERNFRLFASEKLAKSARAMARISQLLTHDERYGGTISDEEWRNNKMVKSVIYRSQGAIARKEPIGEYHFLAFHSSKQRDLFLKENEALIKDFLMI